VDQWPHDTDTREQESRKRFTGTISEITSLSVPLIWAYAAPLSLRLVGTPMRRARDGGRHRRSHAGARLSPPAAVSIVATDLNQPMLDQAAATGTSRQVEWRQADAMSLPFGDGELDAVVCQFGVMFFPDKPKAFAEARRVLRDGGVFLFTVWDRIEENEFADVVTDAVASMFPDDPPQFLRRTPHGYFDRHAIGRDLAAGGFSGAAEITTLEARSRATSPDVPAIAYCQGTPLRSEIEARDARRLADATDLAAQAVANRFGSGSVDGKIQAHIVAVSR
jgi:SAM-dependent methyltransferase